VVKPDISLSSLSFFGTTVTRRSKRTPPSGGTHGKAEPVDSLDEKLRRLGDQYLDEEVPDALLEVLRRGLSRHAPDQADGTDGAIDPDHPPSSKGKR
jgi:hypothetical protein